MQDIHSIGGGGRLFDAGGGDRRLRPQNHRALKCPRCDSLNTKFCYYNNYNLSQPRYFCKACRRYWTKGGVLRNVPVGGGCRKTKRSKPKQTTSTADITITTAAPPPEDQQQEHRRYQKSSNSNSSSESSSVTATNTTTGGNTALSSSSVSNGVDDTKLLGKSNMNSNFHGGSLDQRYDCGVFAEIGSFTSLIKSSNDHLGFGFSNIRSQQDQNERWQQPPIDKEEMKLHESMTGGFIDQTVDVELSGLQSSRSGNGGGFGTLDWQGTGDQGLFDFPYTVDQTYWNHSQWTDQDQPSLYLP